MSAWPYISVGIKDPYIPVANEDDRHCRLCVVPVRRYRLSSVLLLRQAFRQLMPWGPGDAIVLTMPPTVVAKIGELQAEADREAPFPIHVLNQPYPGRANIQEISWVSASDAYVEAVRLCAEEPEIQLYSVGSDWAPRLVLRGECGDQPSLPDDDLCFSLGARAYCDLLEPILMWPPYRIEPADSAEERAVVGRLQKLLPKHRRILVVCHVSAVRGIRRRLGALVRRPPEHADPRPPTVRPMRSPLRLEDAIHYLDDFPRLVYEFDERRRNGRAEWTEGPVRCRLLFSCLQKYFTEKQHQSTRRFERFTQYLCNLLALRRRLFPSVEDLYYAIQLCYDRGVADDAMRFLFSYPGWVEAKMSHRIRPSAETGDSK